MKLLSGILAAMLTSVVALASANAADMYGSAGGYKDGPAFVAVNWTGFYAGVNGGYGWASEDQLVDLVSNPLLPFGGVSPTGGFGGGQIGYNWQGIWDRHLVFGVEADIQGGAINDSQTGLNGSHYKSDLDYFGTIRGRAGYAVDRTLFYFTGGFAYGGLQKSSDAFGPQRFDGVATGYVLGVGVEYKFSPEWSVKGEYQYLNFGKNDPCGVGNGCFSDPLNAGEQKDDAYHTIRLGVNYHLLPGYEPLK